MDCGRHAAKDDVLGDPSRQVGKKVLFAGAWRNASDLFGDAKAALLQAVTDAISERCPAVHEPFPKSPAGGLDVIHVGRGPDGEAYGISPEGARNQRRPAAAATDGVSNMWAWSSSALEVTVSIKKKKSPKQLHKCNSCGRPACAVYRSVCSLYPPAIGCEHP